MSVLTLSGDELVGFVLKYEESCGASANTVSSQKAYPYPERLFGSTQAVSEEAELKKVYKRLAIKLHPDKNTHPDASKAFQVLQTCFEATLEVVSSGRSAAGAGASQPPQQQANKQAPPKQQPASHQTQHRPPQAHQPPPDPHAFFKAQKEAQRQKYYAEAQQQQSAANQAFFEQQRAKYQAQQQKQHPQDDEWENWTEKADKKSQNGPTAPPQPPTGTGSPNFEGMSEADFFAPPNANNTKKKEKNVDEDGYTYYWDEDAQQYYYFDEATNQSYYYDDKTGPAYKKQKRREKEAAAAPSSGGQASQTWGGDTGLPSVDPDFSEEEEAAARVRKLEKRLRKKREANADAAREARKAQRASEGKSESGFWSEEEDDRFRTGQKKNKKKLSDVLNMDLSVSEEEEDADGNVKKKRKKRANMDPEEAALIDELEEAEAHLASIKYAKKEAEKQAAHRAAEKERAKIQKSAQSLASLFAKFGIDDNEDDNSSPTTEGASKKSSTLFGPTGAAKAAKMAKKAKEAALFDAGIPPLGGSSPPNTFSKSVHETSSYSPSATTDGYIPFQTSFNQTMASTTTANSTTTGSSAAKLTPAQALSEKRRLAALAKAAEGGVPVSTAPKSGGTLKIQISCPHCANYSATIPMSDAAKATQCPQCKQYFVPQQQLAATLNAAGSKAGGAARGATIIRGAGNDRCNCGKARKGTCFLCGE